MSVAGGPGFTPDPPIRSKDLRIGCIGAGMIMAECHLAAYKEAGFPVVAIASRTRDRAAQVAERDDLRDLQAWMAEHLDHDLSVAALARQVSMSERHFARRFAAETGVTPARWVDRLRVEAARRLLEESDRSVEQVASDCGFGTAETMRRAFLRLLSTSPSDYRRRFRSSLSA